MHVQISTRRFTVEEYQRMAEAGILGEDDRVELLDGRIVEMMPIGERHAACVRRLNNLLAERARGRAIIDVQDPVYLDRWSLPNPTSPFCGRDPTSTRRIRGPKTSCW